MLQSTSLLFVVGHQVKCRIHRGRIIYAATISSLSRSNRTVHEETEGIVSGGTSGVLVATPKRYLNPFSLARPEIPAPPSISSPIPKQHIIFCLTLWTQSPKTNRKSSRCESREAESPKRYQPPPKPHP